jgi:hypothetical protein
VEVLARREYVIVTVIAAMVTIGILFMTYPSPSDPGPIWDNLSWNIEEGDSYVFNITSFNGYFNNTVIIVNVTALPQFSDYYTSGSFTSSIIETSKIEVRYENGSELGGYDYFVRNLLSKTILPCGEWDLIDSLYVNPENATFGPTCSLSGYISKLESDYFVLGYETVDFDSSSGWNADISLETGLPFYIQYWDYDDFHDHTYSIHMETRITYEIFLVS